jgi:Ubiquitin carboxyl-terminal hydrolase
MSDIQQLIQTFARFFLQLLHREQDSEAKTFGRRTEQLRTDITKVFGIATSTSTTFLQSKTVESGANIVAFSLDLVYPNVSKLSLGAAIPKSFAAILWNSFHKETYIRGWCSSSEAYETCRQIRLVRSLPKMLALLCEDTRKDCKDSTIQGTSTYI